MNNLLWICVGIELNSTIFPSLTDHNHTVNFVWVIRNFKWS